MALFRLPAGQRALRRAVAVEVRYLGGVQLAVGHSQPGEPRKGGGDGQEELVDLDAHVDVQQLLHSGRQEGFVRCRLPVVRPGLIRDHEAAPVDERLSLEPGGPRVAVRDDLVPVQLEAAGAVRCEAVEGRAVAGADQQHAGPNLVAEEDGVVVDDRLPCARGRRVRLLHRIRELGHSRGVVWSRPLRRGLCARARVAVPRRGVGEGRVRRIHGRDGGGASSCARDGGKDEGIAPHADGTAAACRSYCAFLINRPI